MYSKIAKLEHTTLYSIHSIASSSLHPSHSINIPTCEKRVAFRSYKRVLRSHSIATTFEKSEIVQVNMEFESDRYACLFGHACSRSGIPENLRCMLVRACMLSIWNLREFNLCWVMHYSLHGTASVGIAVLANTIIRYYWVLHLPWHLLIGESPLIINTTAIVLILDSTFEYHAVVPQDQ